MTEVDEKGWLHRSECPYAPYADAADDAPDDVACVCGDEHLASRWKARVVLLRAALRAAKAETLREVRGFVSAMRQAENTPTLGEIEHYIDAQLAALSGDQP